MDVDPVKGKIVQSTREQGGLHAKVWYMLME